MAVTWKRLALDDETAHLSLFTAEGDLLTASAANTPSILSIGSAGHVLTVDTDTPGWAAMSVGAHATTHKDGESDELLLNELGEPTGAVAFDGQEAENLVPHTYADTDALALGTPVVGEIVWLTDPGAPYLCTVSA